MSKKQVFKLAPTLKGVAIFYSVILLDLGLVFGKNRKPQDLVVAEISSHISNFALTSMAIALMTFIMALQGATFKFVIWLGIAAIIMNFVVEVLIHTMNTPDVKDALYATLGVIVTTAIMYLFFKVGIGKPVDISEK
jgi:uncharacterized membrane protein